MAITLDTITLDEESVWIDEFSWQPINMNSQYTLQGKQIIQETKIQNDMGRPITLGSSNAWITRNDLLILHSWMAVTNKQMTLTLNDNRVFTVRFRLWEPNVIETTTVIPDIGVVSSDTLYIMNILKLAQV